MKQTIINWAVFGVAALIAGPLAGRLVEMASPVNGASDPTALLSSSPVVSVALYAAAFAIACVVGVVAARLTQVGVALSAAGIVLAWAAWRTERVEEVFRFGHQGGAFWTLAIEGLLMAAGGIIVGACILKASEKLSQDKHEFDGLFSGQSFAGLGAGLFAGAMAAWAIARSDAVGQTFAAAVAAGIAAAVVGRIVSVRAPLLAFVAAGSLLAFAGPAVGAVMNSGDAVRAAYSGTLVPIARVMPIDWIAGILIGVPIGASWAAAMVHKHASAK